jgi:hypothetical protein
MACAGKTWFGRNKRIQRSDLSLSNAMYSGGEMANGSRLFSVDYGITPGACGFRRMCASEFAINPDEQLQKTER